MLLWDCLGTEFGARHELYEINYSGSTEEIRRYCLFGAMGNGTADKLKGFANSAWTSTTSMAGPSRPGDLSFHKKAT